MSREILFQKKPQDLVYFLRECLNCLATYPERSTPEILKDLSLIADAIVDSENDHQHSIEPVKCFLMRDLLRKRPFAGVNTIICSNVPTDGSDPIRISAFLQSSLNPLIGFFNDVKTLMVNLISIGESAVNAQNAEALTSFIRKLQTLENLKDVHLTFPSIQDFSRAVDLGLPLLSFVKLLIEIESFSTGDFEVLAAVLAKEIKIYKLVLPEKFIFSSDRTLDLTFEFFSGLNGLEVIRPITFLIDNQSLESRYFTSKGKFEHQVQFFIIWEIRPRLFTNERSRPHHD